MDMDSSGESDISESWTILDYHAGSLTSSQGSIADETADLLMLSHMSKQLDEMHRSCEALSSSLCDSGRPVIAESVLEKAQSIYDIVMLDSEVKKELLGEYQSDTDSVEVIEAEPAYKELEFDTDGMSVISDGEMTGSRLLARDESPLSERSSLWRRHRRVSVEPCESSDDLSSCNEVVGPEPSYALQTSGVIEEAPCPLEGRVYRHCRNNVANTLLSLAVGAIFTGVACVALGHFLGASHSLHPSDTSISRVFCVPGVHDAEQTANEMMDALKQLQMENVVLQSRLTQLSKAVFATENKAVLPEQSSGAAVLSSTEDIVKHRPELKETIEYKPCQTELPTAESKSTEKVKSVGPLAQLLQSLAEENNQRDHVRGVTCVVRSLHKQMTILEGLDRQQLKPFTEIDGRIVNLVSKISKDLVAKKKNLQGCLDKLTKFNERLSKKMSKVGISVCDKENKENLNMFQWYPEDSKEDVVEQEDFKVNKATKQQNIKGHERKTPVTGKNGLKQKKNNNHHTRALKDEYETNKKLKEKLNKVYKKDKNELKRKKEEWNHQERVKKFKNAKISSEGKKQKKEKWHRASEVSCGSQCTNKTGEWLDKWAHGREQCRKEDTAGEWQFERSMAREHSRDQARWYFKRNDARNHFRKGFSTDTFSWI